MVNKMCYPVCPVSLLLFAVTSIISLWQDVPDEGLWKTAWSFAILAFSALLALSATRNAGLESSRNG